MKQFICIPIFLLISIVGFSQKHSIGLNLNPSISSLEDKHPVSRIIPMNPNFEISYIFQKTEKTAIVSGVGFEYQFLYSDYVNSEAPLDLHLDGYSCITIPIEFRYNAKEWFYLGIGINNKVPFRANGYISDFPDYSYFLEATGSTGVQFDLKI